MCKFIVDFRSVLLPAYILIRLLESREPPWKQIQVKTIKYNSSIVNERTVWFTYDCEGDKYSCIAIS